MIRIAHAGQIERDHAVMFEQKRRDERPPVRVRAVAVNEHDAGFVADAAPLQIVDARAVDGDHAFFVRRLQRLGEPARRIFLNAQRLLPNTTERPIVRIDRARRPETRRSMVASAMVESSKRCGKLFATLRRDRRADLNLRTLAARLHRRCSLSRSRHDAVAADPVASFSPQGTVKTDSPGHRALYRADGRARRSTPRRSVRHRLSRARTRSLGRRTQLGLRLRRRSARRRSLHVQAARRTAQSRRRARCERRARSSSTAADRPFAHRFRTKAATIDADQVFMLALDAQATPASIERAAYCAIDGLGERVPVRVLDGDERAAILASAPRTRLQLLPDSLERRRHVDRTRARSRARRRRSATRRPRVQARTAAPTRRCNSSGAPASRRRAESRRRSIRRWRSRCGRHSPRIVQCESRQRARRLHSAATDSIAVQRAGAGGVGRSDAHRRPLTEPRWRRSRLQAEWRRSKS